MSVRLASRLAIAAILGVTMLSACGSKNTLGSVIDPYLHVSPNPLNLSGTGASAAGQIVATDNGLGDTINVTTSCTSGSKPIAAVSPSSGQTPLTVTVTPQNVGACTVIFSDTNGLTRTATVDVTTSGIGVTSRSQK